MNLHRMSAFSIYFLFAVDDDDVRYDYGLLNLMTRFIEPDFMAVDAFHLHCCKNQDARLLPSKDNVITTLMPTFLGPSSGQGYGRKISDEAPSSQRFGL